MGLYPKALESVMTGLPWGPKSNAYIVDPVNGSDSNKGTSWGNPLLTLEAAYALCVDGQNDVVVLVGGPTALNPATAIVWAKSYTHLVGLSAPLALGQRCRVVNTAAKSLAVLFTLSGSGCIVKNVQFYDGKNTAADGACVLVSGSRNYFENVFVAGMGDATASGPSTRATSYSLQVSGAENLFKDCTVGLDTIQRTAASSEAIISGVRTKFRHCEFRTQGLAAAGNFLVQLLAANSSQGGDTEFEDCLFFNATTNWAAGTVNAFSMPAAGDTHWAIMRGKNMLVGNGLTWADNLTHMFGADAVPAAGFGVSVNPTS
jgi:hypothetical protein